MSNSWFVERKHCPACSSSRSKKVYEAPYDSGPIADYLVDFYSSKVREEFSYLKDAHYILLDCESCGMIYQRDVPGDILMGRIYDHWIAFQQAAGLQPHPNLLPYYANYSQEVMQIVDYIGKPPEQQRIFDFGMGWCHWALMVKAFGCQAFGTELSEARLAHARTVGVKVVSWDENPAQQFDMINTEQVFEHIPQPLETLRHLKKALAPAGILKVSVPDSGGIDKQLQSMDWSSGKNSASSLNAVAPLEHINCFRRDSIIKMAEAAGMVEVRIPMRVQYRHAADWSSVRAVGKNLLLPIMRNVLKNRNYVFLRNRA